MYEYNQDHGQALACMAHRHISDVATLDVDRLERTSALHWGSLMIN